MKSPVALLVFNRPECTARTFAAVRAARPPKLLVVADGPRAGRPDDVEKTKQVRQIISDGVDWECEVLCNLSETNLGCAQRVSSGLRWAFGNVDRLVVVEDDCLPDPTFFRFCDELLERYRDDTRIGQICGTPFLENEVETKYSYLFSRYGPIWGWASWARAWKYYDLELKSWPEIRQTGALASVVSNGVELKQRTALYDRLLISNMGTWDFQWGYAKMVNSLLSIIPSRSLIENIGFGADSTHTAGITSKLRRHALSFPLRHPLQVLPDPRFAEDFSVASCGRRTKRLPARLLNSVNRLFYSIT